MSSPNLPDRDARLYRLQGMLRFPGEDDRVEFKSAIAFEARTEFSYARWRRTEVVEPKMGVQNELAST